MLKVDIQKIIIERANQGLTRRDLSKLSDVREVTIARMEKGNKTPRLDTIGKIAKALGKGVEDFVINE